ncbi:MAG TPA: YchJ family metal-binding protein [Planktothrix sp.]
MPENALTLMRSRYCAYARNLSDYIIATTHCDNKAFQSDTGKWKRELTDFSRNTKFDGLKILEFVDDFEIPTVTFTATLRQGDQDATFTEKSYFKKENGRWLYHSGEMQND